MQKWLKIVTCLPVFMSFIWLEGMDDTKNKCFISWAMNSRQGARDEMEDELCVAENVNGDKRSALLGLFDGHLGRNAAQYANKNFVKRFEENLKKCSTVQVALQQSFSCIDEEIQEKFTSGTAALVTYLRDDEAYFACAGDSRALMIRDGKVIFSTRDHKPDDPEEKKRIEDAGGKITYSLGIARVNNGLSLSRSLGDRWVKKTKGDPIIAVPEIVNIKTNPGDILVSACDGVWDPLTNDRVNSIIQHLLKHGNPEDLVKLFIKNGTISPYYGNEEELLLYERLKELPLKDEDVDAFNALTDLDIKYGPWGSSFCRKDEDIFKDFTNAMGYKGDKEMYVSGNDDNLANIAKTISNFSFALSKGFYEDNISLIVTQINPK